ncbi:hypothetical protein OROGR_022379 [Orobanche gracilis]
MLLTAKRKEVGDVCGHPIYAISKYKLIRIPHKSVKSEVQNHSDQSSGLNIQFSLKTSNQAGAVWLLGHARTRGHGQGIRTPSGLSIWFTAVLQAVKLSEFGFDLSLTLIARRSRLHAGTRYIKRGVNEEGQAANDVEIEQIVCREICGGFPYKLNSMVQNRGSVPLFWGQANSWINLKPKISILDVDDDFKATRHHFEELTKRYGNPIVILSLLKCCDKITRESYLRAEYCRVVDIINTGFGKAKQLEFIGMNLDGIFHTEGASVLTLLNLVTEEVLNCTEFITYEVLPAASILETIDTSRSWYSKR